MPNVVEEPSSVITNLIPYVHVADVERSIAFYQKLGLEVESTFDNEGRTVWAHLRHGAARIMFALASQSVDQRAQAVLFYLYATDVATLRKDLLEVGIRVGSIAYPDHMPLGEIRVTDPDGYVLLIGQLVKTG